MITDRAKQDQKKFICLSFKLKETRTDLYADGNALVRREWMLWRRDGGEGEEVGEDVGSLAEGGRVHREHSSSIAGLLLSSHDPHVATKYVTRGSISSRDVLFMQNHTLGFKKLVLEMQN